jgi:hypothetical protein
MEGGKGLTCELFSLGLGKCWMGVPHSHEKVKVNKGSLSQP